MSAVLQILHLLAGLVMVAEALNKLERTDPLLAGLTGRQRVTEWLKAIAWFLLGLGGGGALVTPILHLEPPTFQDTCIAVGFAVLIVRTRVKEG